MQYNIFINFINNINFIGKFMGNRETSWEKQNGLIAERERNRQQNEITVALTAFGVFAIGGAIIGAACSGAAACVAGLVAVPVAGYACFYVIAKYGRDAAESVCSAGEHVNNVLQTIKRESQAIAGSLENFGEKIFDGIKDCLKTQSEKEQPQPSCHIIKPQNTWTGLRECCLRREK